MVSRSRSRSRSRRSRTRSRSRSAKVSLEPMKTKTNLQPSQRSRGRDHSRSPMSNRRRHEGNRENPDKSRCIGVFLWQRHLSSPVRSKAKRRRDWPPKFGSKKRGRIQWRRCFLVITGWQRDCNCFLVITGVEPNEGGIGAGILHNKGKGKRRRIL